jgi:hypothetical protein
MDKCAQHCCGSRCSIAAADVFSFFLAADLELVLM